MAIAATFSLVAPLPAAAGAAEPAVGGTLLSDSEPPDFDLEQLQSSARSAVIAHVQDTARWRMGPPGVRRRRRRRSVTKPAGDARKQLFVARGHPSGAPGGGGSLPAGH